ncbi:uncharacterized protein [Diadema setosum]|uniref:uncharacterized protein n=1 Tax=Diadema setosum TaxID=31175 RepID=UPI003B3B5194
MQSEAWRLPVTWLFVGAFIEVLLGGPLPHWRGVAEGAMLVVIDRSHCDHTMSEAWRLLVTWLFVGAFIEVLLGGPLPHRRGVAGGAMLVVIDRSHCDHTMVPSWTQAMAITLTLRRGTSQLSDRANDYSDDGQLQMDAVNISIRNQRTTNMVDSSGIIAVGLPLPSHEENRFGDTSPEQEDPYHIYQDTAEVDQEVPLHAGMTSLTAENNLACHEYHSLQETSLQHTANSYEDCVYQDVDLDNKTDSMTKDDFKSTGRACLFDDSCYNSLNFGERPDLVFAHSGKTCLDSEYDSIYHVSQDDVAPIHHPVSSASCSISGNDDNNMTCFIPAKSVPSDDLLDNKVYGENSHDFDSGEYSCVREDGNNDTENLVCFTQEPKPCEELYATVNKSAKTSSSATPPCEELYAKVDKTRGDHTDVKQASQKELYMNVTNIM